MSRQRTKKLLKIGGFIIIFLVVLGYTLFNSSDFLRGPQIIIEEPENGSTFFSADIVVKGIVLRSQDMSVNGKSVLVDEKGNFKENTLLSPGNNVITLLAKDKFNRIREYRLELVYKVN